MRREDRPAQPAVPQPRVVEEEKSEEEEVEINSASINSAVINELFEGVLEQSDDTPSSTGEEEEEEEEEEDALNISSMSLLTPLAETVASVIRSPERRELMVRGVGVYAKKGSLHFFMKQHHNQGLGTEATQRSRCPTTFMLVGRSI